MLTSWVPLMDIPVRIGGLAVRPGGHLGPPHPPRLLGAAEPDVEAVLLCRDSHASEAEYFIVPIDVCYELAGRMRMLWKGFDGGSEARASIEEFLAGVRKHARDASPAGRPAHG